MDMEISGTEHEPASENPRETPAVGSVAAQIPDQMAIEGTAGPVAGLQAPCPCGPEKLGEIELESYLSHTVRTQLTVITLLCTNLDLLYDRLEDEKRRQMIRDLCEQTRLLNGLVISALEVLQRPE